MLATTTPTIRFQSRDVTFNILAPGVVQDHYTLGFTYNVEQGFRTDHGLHACAEADSVMARVCINCGWLPGAAGNEANLHMYQDSLGIAYGMKF